MTARLIFLILFVATVGSSFWLYTYYDHFNKEHPLNTQALEQEITDFHKREEMAKLALAHGEDGHESATKSAPEEDGKIDLNNPKIKAGMEIYVEKGQCIACHGEQGEGNPDLQAPLLAGQHEWYVYGQLMAMKNKERLNEAMQPSLEGLSEKDFQNVALYVSKLRVRAASEASATTSEEGNSDEQTTTPEETTAH